LERQSKNSKGTRKVIANKGEEDLEKVVPQRLIVGQGEKLL
jgi:hypothetical protein